MRRRALLVGIDHYDHMRELRWCIDDVLAMRQVLEYHENHDPNFDCRVLFGTESAFEASISSADLPHERVTFNKLRTALEELLAFDDMVLFYFSGHGYPTADGVYLVTQDGTNALPGILLNDILEMANASPAREVLLIIDSCFSGALGEPGQKVNLTNLYLRPGVTLLAATGTDQYALEIDGHSVFTRLVLGALKGGAADVRGQVSTASIYAYVEQALGSWDQRPVYKSNATQLSPVRYCKPDVTDDELRRLPQFFSTPDRQYSMDPSYEVTRPEALPEHLAIFKLFKRYRDARLLRPSFDEDLYFAAIRSHPVELTPLGQFYWQLAKDNLIGGTASFPAQRRFAMPDPESVAKLFHETYERLAPTFEYKTRSATRVPWEKVPERNKRLMVAVAAEVLAVLFPLEEQPAASIETRRPETSSEE